MKCFSLLFLVSAVNVLSLPDVLVRVNHVEGQHHGEDGDSLKALFAPLMNSDNGVEDDVEATTRTKGYKEPKTGTRTKGTQKKCKKDKDKGSKGDDNERDEGCGEGEFCLVCRCRSIPSY